jgi:hypothetical protein
MLSVHPRSWWSWSFTVTEGGRVLAEANVALLRSHAVFHVDGGRYEGIRPKLTRREYHLERMGEVLLRARKQGVLRVAYEFSWGGRRLRLHRAGVVRRAFDLVEGDAVLGQIRPDHLFTRKATADLPVDIPVEIRVFLIWLVMLQWRHDAAAAGSG